MFGETLLGKLRLGEKDVLGRSRTKRKSETRNGILLPRRRTSGAQCNETSMGKTRMSIPSFKKPPNQPNFCPDNDYPSFYNIYNVSIVPIL